MEWRDIPGYEGAYQASADGEIRALPRIVVRSNGKPQPIMGGIRKPVARKRDGYMQVNISVNGKSRAIKVHTAVALAFFGPKPEGMQVAHWNGEKSDNRASNLRYATPAENAIDAARLGERENVPRGTGHHNCKLTPEAVKSIREANGPQAKIAAKFGITQSHVHRIKARTVWSHV